MTIVKANTAKGQTLLARANRNLGTELSDVYTTWSSSKASAMRDCRRWCYEDSGRDFRIISANGWQFSVAWETDKGTRIETASNSYFVEAV